MISSCEECGIHITSPYFAQSELHDTLKLYILTILNQQQQYENIEFLQKYMKRK